MKKTFAFLFGSLAALTGVISCNNDDNGSGGTLPYSSFGIVHAIPDAGNVDVYLGGSLAAQNLGFGTDTGYYVANPGTYSIQVAPTGTSDYILNSSISLQPGAVNSIFAIDTVGAVMAAVVNDNFSVPGTDTADVRFFHFSPDAPAVDVAVSGGSVLFTNRTFNDQSADTSLQHFMPITAGTYNLEVRAAGTSTVLLSLPGTILTGGKVYTLYAKGLSSGDGGQTLGVGTIVHNE